MSSSDKLLLAGVMGWPVMHSRSPLLHGHWFSELGLKGAYPPLAIAPERLEAALRALPALGFAGCNLTIPHKETAMRIVDRVDEVARRIGAISCVTVEADGSLSGVNNDWWGFTENLREAFPGWTGEGEIAVVVGAGGGARAVVHALARAGTREIRLVNRTFERAEIVATALGPRVTPVDWRERAAALEGAGLLVNATSQGMAGTPALDLPLDSLPRDARVCDIIYIPAETPLLRAARLGGRRTVNGLGMLLHQARPAWRAWFGLDPQVTPELRRVIEASLA